MSRSRSIMQTFDQYQRARLAFVQAIAELARPQNIEILYEAKSLELLKSLLTDPCQQIQQGAAVALGRLVSMDVKMAQLLLYQNFLPILIASINSGNKHHKRSVLYVVRSICKHNEQLASEVVGGGGLQVLLVSLEDFDVTVKESAACGIGYISRHSPQLAGMCVEGGGVPLLLLCLQEPEVSLKLVATSALADIAKHGVQLAQSVVDAGVVPHLVKNLSNTDERLKKQILYALSCCAKHNVNLAEVVVEAEIFPGVLLHLGHPCKAVKRNAACLIRDIVQHSLELTQLVVNNGGIGALMEMLQQEAEVGEQLPIVTALGFITGHSDQLAQSVIGAKAISCLSKLLMESTDDSLLAVVAWSIGQIGKHSPEHSQAVAAQNLFPRLLELYMDKGSSEDLQFKCKNTLKLCLQKCMLLSALEPLLYDAPPNILKYVLGQYSKVLPQDPKARRLFVTSGGLKKVQEIDVKPGTTLYEYVSVINSSFPDEIVRYYSPGYPQSLLDKVEQYSPQMLTVLRETSLLPVKLQTEIVATEGQLSSDEDVKAP